MALPARKLLVLLCFFLAWVLVRAGLEENLTQSARRDLDTIVELVSADLESARGGLVVAKGGMRIQGLAVMPPAWVLALQRSGEENHRRVYFFDAMGHVIKPTGAFVQTTTAIVDQAIAARLGPMPPEGGVRFQAYLGKGGERSVGVWRWLPHLELGVVAERPHLRYALPLYSVDGIFASLLALYAFRGITRRYGQQRERGQAMSHGTPDRIGPYRIEGFLGEGAMSRIYLARHLYLGRRVALKHMKLYQCSDELSHRFEREFRLASRLHHPNIITIFDYGRMRDGGYYYTMEYVEGLTLTRLVSEHGPLTAERVIHILRQVTSALVAMHKRCLLHRDIKPDNVMAYAAHGQYDRVKLLDFGLVRDYGQDASRDLTRSVRALGTPAFMAPERLTEPNLVDPRSDLYGVGCIGFWLLTGRRPFEAATDSDLVQQICHVEAPRASCCSSHVVPSELDDLIADCLAKDMAWRPADAETLLARLDRLATENPWQEPVAREWWGQWERHTRPDLS